MLMGFRVILQEAQDLSSPAQESDGGWPVLPPARFSSPPSSPTAGSVFSVVPQKRPNLIEFSEGNIVQHCARRKYTYTQ